MVTAIECSERDICCEEMLNSRSTPENAYLLGLA